MLLDVPYLSQGDEYPTGCEMVSATMLLQYYHYNISIEEYLDYLDVADFYWKNDILYGPDPRKQYAGDPTNPYSCGCYAPVIADSMNRILRKDQRAVVLGNMSLEDLLNFIDLGDPVLIWASMEMIPTRIGDQWTVPDTGETITWMTPEHCLVLVGYNEEYYFFNDPSENKGLVCYPKDLAEQRYQELGQQAVVISSR